MHNLENRASPIVKNFYNILLLALLFLGIDLIYNPKNRILKTLKSIIKALNVSVLLIFTVFTIIKFSVIGVPGWQLSFGSIILGSWGIVFRFVLAKKGPSIALLLKSLESVQYSSRLQRKMAKATKILYIICATVGAIQLLMTATHRPHINGHLCYVRFWKDLLGDDHYSFMVVIWALSMLMSCFYNQTPLIIFGVFYSAHCWHLMGIIEDFRETIEASPEDTLQHAGNYNKICLLVKSADNNLRSLVLMVVCYVSATFYALLFVIFQGSIVFQSLLIVFASSLVVLALCCMMSYASDILDANADLLEAVRHFSDESKVSNEKLEFILNIQKGVSLSVGGISTIGRGLFLSLLGTIATYCLLVNSLPTGSKDPLANDKMDYCKEYIVDSA